MAQPLDSDSLRERIESRFHRLDHGGSVTLGENRRTRGRSLPGLFLFS